MEVGEACGVLEKGSLPLEYSTVTLNLYFMHQILKRLDLCEIYCCIDSRVSMIAAMDVTRNAETLHLLHLRMYVHTVVAPDVLLKYRLAEMINGNWSECSKCLEVSDHEVCDIQSWYTACVERAYTVLDIFHEQCGKKSRNFVEEIEKRLSCLPKFPELQRALNSTDHLCVRKLCEFLQ